MTTRTARCACGRVEVTVEGEPRMVYVCHCEFCQRRSGNVFIASAQFDEAQVVSITGETTRYNGLEVDGVGAVAIDGGIDYHFCSVCGSSMYLNNVMPLTGERHHVVEVHARAADRAEVVVDSPVDRDGADPVDLQAVVPGRLAGDRHDLCLVELR